MMRWADLDNLLPSRSTPPEDPDGRIPTLRDERGTTDQSTARDRPQDRPRVWIVVPAYNEASRIGATLQDLLSVYQEIVVVDDGSTDETSNVTLHYPVWLVRHLFNCGQGAALQTGIEFALRQGADIVVSFDADGQHRSDDIARLVEPVANGSVDVCLGSRFLLQSCPGIPIGRWILLRLAVYFTRLTSCLKVTDTHNGLRALSRAAAQSLRIQQSRMAHASEILANIRKYGWRYCEVPVTVLYRQDTLRKGQNDWDALEILAQLLAGRFLK